LVLARRIIGIGTFVQFLLRFCGLIPPVFGAYSVDLIQVGRVSIFYFHYNIIPDCKMSARRFPLNSTAIMGSFSITANR
jgi:hypothetical protein